MPAVHDVKSSEDFKSLLSEDLTKVSLLNFWAPWADPCVDMNKVVEKLSDDYPQLLVLNVRCPRVWKYSTCDELLVL